MNKQATRQDVALIRSRAARNRQGGHYMDHNELTAALRNARKIFVVVMGSIRTDTVHYFQISRAEASRVLLDQQSDNVYAVRRESNLYIGLAHYAAMPDTSHMSDQEIGAAHDARAVRIQLAVEMTSARKVQVTRGDHTHAYWSTNTDSWWLVTDDALHTLGERLQNTSRPVDQAEVLYTWEENDNTAREIVEPSERRWLALPRTPAGADTQEGGAPPVTVTSADEPARVTVTLKRASWEHISRVLTDCKGNRSEAARRLGIPRQSLQRRLRKHTLAE